MNKEVNYVLHGFLLTLVALGAFKFSGYLVSITHYDEPKQEGPQLFCGTSAPVNDIPYTPASSRGKTLFQDNCASCHAVFKDLTGPALAGIQERITDTALLYKWVHNPAAVLKSGNVYFNKLAKRFGNTVMTAFPSLSNDEIDAIVEYIEITKKRQGY